MSVVVMHQWADKALIVTDTIASDRASGDVMRPTGFGMKVWTLPHMNMVFAFRGASVLGYLWHHHLTETRQCRDIEDVHEVATTSLKNLVNATERRYGPDIAGDFYHFGFPHESDRIALYRYKSSDDYGSDGKFEVEASTDAEYENMSLLIAPAPVTFDDSPVLRDVPDYVDLVTRIKDENDRLLVDDPIAIGGDLFATFVENWKIRTVLWHRFPDYDSTWDSIRGQAASR